MSPEPDNQPHQDTPPPKKAIWPIVVAVLGLLSTLTGLLNYFGLNGQTLLHKVTTKEWNTEIGIHASNNIADLPEFPTKLKGFQPTKEGTDYFGDKIEQEGTVRVMAGEWQGIEKFPASMNDCSQGMYMLRWRTSNEQAQVDSGSSYMVEGLNEKDATIVTGNSGYITGTNCEQPFFRFKPADSNSGNMVDVSYKLMFWKIAP